MNLSLLLRATPWVFLAIALTVLGLESRDLKAAKGTLALHASCLAAVKGQPKAGSPELSCDPAIARAASVAARATACEAGLNPLDGLVVLAVCSPEVQRLVGQVATDSRSLESARTALDAANTDRTQAVARAEARGRAQTQRDLLAKAARDSAPHDADGLRVYDAERLRQRWGGARAPAAGQTHRPD